MTFRVGPKCVRAQVILVKKQGCHVCTLSHIQKWSFRKGDRALCKWVHHRYLIPEKQGLFLYMISYFAIWHPRFFTTVICAHIYVSNLITGPYFFWACVSTLCTILLQSYVLTSRFGFVFLNDSLVKNEGKSWRRREKAVAFLHTVMVRVLKTAHTKFKTMLDVWGNAGHTKSCTVPQLCHHTCEIEAHYCTELCDAATMLHSSTSTNQHVRLCVAKGLPWLLNLRKLESFPKQRCLWLLWFQHLQSKHGV